MPDNMYLSNHSEFQPVGDVVRMSEGRVNIRDQQELVAHIVADALAGRGGSVFTLNLDHLVKLREEPRFRAAYQRASYVSADGAPVVIMAKGLGEPVDRVTGADLVLPLCEAAAAAGVPIFLFGTSDMIRDKATARMLADYPNLVIAGSESPALGFDPEGDAAREAALSIEASGRAYLLRGAGRAEAGALRQSRALPLAMASSMSASAQRSISSPATRSVLPSPGSAPTWNGPGAWSRSPAASRAATAARCSTSSTISTVVRMIACCASIVASARRDPVPAGLPKVQDTSDGSPHHHAASDRPARVEGRRNRNARPAYV